MIEIFKTDDLEIKRSRKLQYAYECATGQEQEVTCGEEK